MKKWKFFMSLLKERDWLEEMAAKGWLLKDMTLGMLYHFEEIEPTRKVYEIDRFTVFGKPKTRMLTARTTAFDIARQSGWEIVTHDEDMNYYFVKDKAGDESDEFYDDDTRKERAEKYRRHLGYEQPVELLSIFLFVTIIYALKFLYSGVQGERLGIFLIIYIFCALLITGVSLASVFWGQRYYDELCLSREEWEHRKRYGEKRKFNKTDQLLTYLQDKNAQGLVLSDCVDGMFLFDETNHTYHYEIDTKHALKKRMKEEGKKYQEEKKDWNMQSIQWYEMSIDQARKHGLELVCVIDAGTLVYKRECREDVQEPAFHPEIHEHMGFVHEFADKGWIWAMVFLIGAVAGFLAAWLR